MLLCMQVGQGAGYVYMHQGCCEHLVELLDVRSIHHAELLQSQPISYPFVLKEVRLCYTGLCDMPHGMQRCYCESSVGTLLSLLVNSYVEPCSKRSLPETRMHRVSVHAFRLRVTGGIARCARWQTLTGEQTGSLTMIRMHQPTQHSGVTTVIVKCTMMRAGMRATRTTKRFITCMSMALSRKFAKAWLKQN